MRARCQNQLVPLTLVGPPRPPLSRTPLIAQPSQQLVSHLHGLGRANSRCGRMVGTLGAAKRDSLVTCRDGETLQNTCTALQTGHLTGVWGQLIASICIFLRTCAGKHLYIGFLPPVCLSWGGGNAAFSAAYSQRQTYGHRVNPEGMAPRVHVVPTRTLRGLPPLCCLEVG